MSALKLVIFDVDGTLVDSQNTIVSAMDAAFGLLGRDAPARSDLLSIVGLSLPEAFARLAPWAKPAERDRLVEGYKDAYATARAGGAEGAPFYPGAKELLHALSVRDDVLLGVATGKSRRGLKFLIENHGLEGMFQTIQVADDHPSKPHPSMIFAALSDCGVAPGDAVMIGDTTFDMEMARAGGVAAIGVTWGYHPRDALTAAGATQVVADFAALASVLSERLGAA